MKSLVEFLTEAKVDHKKVDEAVKKAIEMLKKENKEWFKHAQNETSRIGDDDFEKHEEAILDDHTEAPAIWKLVEKTAELLKMDADDLFEEVGLYPFADVH